MALLTPGTRVGDFVVEAVLGRGGMGVVYRAIQQRLGRPVALKVLSPLLASDPAFTERFVREARIMRDLEHPAIVPVHDTGTADGVLYLAMRLLETRTLRDELDGGPLPPQRALDVLGPLAEALDHAHSRGVVHRDLKPSNVLLDAAGRPYLTDFGIAKALESASLTLSGQTLGTPRYMAPEQATGTVGHRSDLYALACIAFEVLTGAPPFPAADPAALLYAHAHRPPPAATALRPGLPAAVDPVLARGLAKDPLDRYGSAGELVAALRGALTGPATGAVTVPVTRQAAPRPAGRIPRALVGAAAVAVIAVAASVLTVALTRGGATGPPGVAAPTTGPSTSPTASRTPTAAPVARGALIFGPVLDGSGAGFRDAPDGSLDRAIADIRHVDGALELEARTTGGFAYVETAPGRPLTTYILDAELSVAPGTRSRFCISLRWATGLAWYWCLHPQAEQAGFHRFDGQQMTALSEPVSVPGLQTGRRVRITVDVEAQRLTLYLDGQQVDRVDDTSVPVANTIPGLELAGTSGPGLVRVTQLKFFERGA
ncbi:MAG: serine/threonine protein kinase [Pseudonocardia sp.]|nr:serine/threonine protein kinase [Pseudonocardia sp.]